MSRTYTHTDTDTESVNDCVSIDDKTPRATRPEKSKTKPNRTAITRSARIYGNRCELTVNKMNGKQRFRSKDVRCMMLGKDRIFSFLISLYLHSFFLLCSLSIKIRLLWLRSGNNERMKKGRERRKK